MATQKDAGFTLIELLVVIIIIGILSAIALPAFLSQANKAKQSEAKQNIGSLNRAQQAYYLENSAFASTVTNLGLGIQTQSVNYLYSTSSALGGEGGGISESFVHNLAIALKAPLRFYTGRVELQTIVATSESTTLAILCESRQTRANQPTPSTTGINTANQSCGTDYRLIDSR